MVTSIPLRVGLIGYPLRHSISPAFQQAAFDDSGLSIRYETWETPPERVSQLTALLRRDDTLGANVTIPYKQVVMPLLDDVDPVAVAVGAVNTIVHQGSRLLGFNTDVGGFSESLRRDGDTELKDKRVIVLGAGGAARAVVMAAIESHAVDVVICSRRLAQSEGLVSDLNTTSLDRGVTRLRARAYDETGHPPLDLLLSADILVNATPQGTAHHSNETDLPISVESLHPGLVVVDLVYNPPETPLLRAARFRGIRTLNGLPMLVYQGAAAFELWTGRSAPIDLMRRVAREALGV